MPRSPICAATLPSWVFALGLTLHGATLPAAPRTRIQLAVDQTIRSLDPRQTVDANFLSLEELIHCSLFTLDAQGQPVAGIAAASPVWKSAQVLEVKVKDAVKFSDGSTLTAEDVAATWRSLVIDSSLARSASVRILSDVQARDANVIFTLKEADPDFISKLALGILPAKWIRTAQNDYLRMPVCGPYFVKSHDANRVVLEKNPHHDQARDAGFQVIEFQTVAEEGQRMKLLQSGDLDLVQNSLSRDALKALAKNPQLDVIKHSGMNTTSIGFNMSDPLAGHRAVREAIAHAINRKSIIDQILGGFAVPASSLLPPGSPFHPKGVETRAWDPARAEKILDAAGFKKKGQVRFELTLKTTTNVMDIHIAKAVASQLKKIGIHIVVQPLEAKNLDEDVRQGRMQLWSQKAFRLRTPEVLWDDFFSQNVPPRGNNRARYRNPKLDALLEKGRINSSPEQRVQIHQQVQELLNQDPPYVFLWHEDQVAVLKRSLKGFTLDADGRYTGLLRASFSDQGP